MHPEGMLPFNGGENRNLVAMSKCSNGFDMIHMVVSYKYGANMFEIVTMLLQTFANGANTNAYINENAIVAIPKKIAVATTTTAKTEKCILIGWE